MMNDIFSNGSTWEALEQVFVLFDCLQIFLGNDTVLHCIFALLNVEVLFIIAIFIFLGNKWWLDTVG